MTIRQTQAVLRILDREHKQGLKELLTVHALAVHADPKELQKMIK